VLLYYEKIGNCEKLPKEIEVELKSQIGIYFIKNNNFSNLLIENLVMDFPFDFPVKCKIRNIIPYKNANRVKIQ